jgi:dGTPase
MEAQVMDWADDVAYSVHDVEDGVLSGRITLGVLWDLVELAEPGGEGCAPPSVGTPPNCMEAADRLREMDARWPGPRISSGGLPDLVSLKGSDQ